MLRTPYGHLQYAQAGVAVYNFARDSKNVEMRVDAALAEDDFLPVANDAVSLEGECTSSNADIT